MIKKDSEKLMTLSEISQGSNETLNKIYKVQTEIGSRYATLRKVIRPDTCLIADVRTLQNSGEITSHIVVNPLKTRIFISQTTLPSHQKLEKKS